MRTLNDYFLHAGRFTALQTAANATDTTAVVPDAGELLGVYFNANTVMDAATTLNIFKNNVDTTVNLIVPNATADETGVFLTPSSRVFVAAGDALHMTSDGEQTAATTANAIYVIRR